MKEKLDLIREIADTVKYNWAIDISSKELREKLVEYLKDKARLIVEIELQKY